MAIKLPKIGGLGPAADKASDAWTPQHLRRDFARRDVEIARADELSMKKGQDIHVGRARLILRSPNGHQWVVTVDDAGILAAVAI